MIKSLFTTPPTISDYRPAREAREASDGKPAQSARAERLPTIALWAYKSPSNGSIQFIGYVKTGGLHRDGENFGEVDYTKKFDISGQIGISASDRKTPMIVLNALNEEMSPLLATKNGTHSLCFAKNEGQNGSISNTMVVTIGREKFPRLLHVDDDEVCKALGVNTVEGLQNHHEDEHRLSGQEM